MKLWRDHSELASSQAGPSVVTIGNFDGVHIGHRHVLRSARELADQHRLPLVVLTFEPHPAELLHPERRRLRLTDLEHKATLLCESGVDVVLAQNFDESFSKLSPAQFVEQVLVESLQAEFVLVGSNFHFGASQRGDVNVLRRFGERHGFEVQVRALTTEGGDAISSSRIRGQIQTGDVRGAARLLGREYTLHGSVTPGKQEGRKLGFPTINVSAPEVLLPGDGVYASRVEARGVVYSAAAYLGKRPTLGHGFSIEAHLLDFTGDLYDEPVAISFVDQIRSEKKFESREELVTQMVRDVERARSLLENQANPEAARRDSFVTPAMVEILLGQNLVNEASKIIKALEKKNPNDPRIKELKKRSEEMAGVEEVQQEPRPAQGRDEVLLYQDSEAVIKVAWEMTDDGAKLARRVAVFSGRNIVRLFVASPGPRGVRTSTRDIDLELNPGAMTLLGLPRPAVCVAAVGYLANTGVFVPLSRTEPFTVSR